MDEFSELEKIKIPALRDGCAAVGWIAHSSYLGAIPKKLNIRGLRARVGNIQIGDETVFNHLFSEARFNQWCVAEVHIADPNIVPNGRRDYFEPNVHLRNLENHLGVVCRKLEGRCRTASKNRYRHRQIRSFLENVEATHGLASSGYLSTRVARQVADKKIAEMPVFLEKCEDHGNAENVEKLDELIKKLRSVKTTRVAPLAGVKSADVPVYRKIFEIIAETSSSPIEAKKTIETILNHKSGS